MEEPVLQYEALQDGQQFPAIPCGLDDAFVEAYLQATGEHHPLFAPALPGTTTGGYAPPLCTSLVRFVKASLRGRWPTGTVHLSQEVRLVRPLRRGETLTLDVRIGQKYIRHDRRYVELLTTTRDHQDQPVVQGTMLMLWAGATQPTAQTQPPRASAGQACVGPQAIPDGRELTPVMADFPRSRLEAYGDVAAARDPIHLDPEYGRQTRFGNNIAQGLLVLTLLSRLMTRAFAERWLACGTLKARFVKPVFVSDQVTARGVLMAGSMDQCAVWCDNQHDQRVIDGTGGLA